MDESAPQAESRQACQAVTACLRSRGTAPTAHSGLARRRQGCLGKDSPSLPGGGPWGPRGLMPSKGDPTSSTSPLWSKTAPHMASKAAAKPYLPRRGDPMPCGGDPTTGPFWSGPKMSRTFGQCRAVRASLRISMRTICHTAYTATERAYTPQHARD